MKKNTKYALKVGKPYLATDTNTTFVSSNADVHGAWLAKSEHLYVEVKKPTPNVNAVRRNKWRYNTPTDYSAALNLAAVQDNSLLLT